MNSVNPLFGRRAIPLAAAFCQVMPAVTNGISAQPRRRPRSRRRSEGGIHMCGRYASARSRIELLEEFAVERDRVDESLKPDYNVAPTKPVYAVMTRKPRPDAAKSDKSGEEAARRELRVVRWGLVPSWAKDVSIGSRMINARAETVSEKPAFRRAF